MMDYARDVTLDSVRDLTTYQLDFFPIYVLGIGRFMFNPVFM